MVTKRTYGRLGNWLFQTAAVVGYAIRHGMEYHIPQETNDKKWNPVYMPHLQNPNYNNHLYEILINEHQHNYKEIQFIEEWRNKNIVLNGYWQSELYFEHCKDEVLKAFDFPYEMNKDVCSVHVRRGDYLLYPTKHPVVNEVYLKQAMWYMLEFKGISHFKFFSDDIAWCKQFVNDGDPDNFTTEYSEGKSEMTDLIEQSNCQHNIISNSTLSWWAAYLNKNPYKTVVCPHTDNWFGVDNKHLDVSDLYPKDQNWIQIKY